MSKFDAVNKALERIKLQKDVQDPQNQGDVVTCVQFGCVFNPAAVSAPDGWTLTYYPSAPLIPLDPEDPAPTAFLPQLPQVGDMWDMRTIPFQLGVAGTLDRALDLQSWPLSVGTLQVPALEEVLEGLDTLIECGVVLLTDVEFQGPSVYEVEYWAIRAAMLVGASP